MFLWPEGCGGVCVIIVFKLSEMKFVVCQFIALQFRVVLSMVEVSKVR